MLLRRVSSGLSLPPTYPAVVRWLKLSIFYQFECKWSFVKLHPLKVFLFKDRLFRSRNRPKVWSPNGPLAKHFSHKVKHKFQIEIFSRTQQSLKQPLSWPCRESRSFEVRKEQKEISKFWIGSLIVVLNHKLWFTKFQTKISNDSIWFQSIFFPVVRRQYGVDLEFGTIGWPFEQFAQCTDKRVSHKEFLSIKESLFIGNLDW